MDSTLKPVLDSFDPSTSRYHKLWRFANGYGVSAIKQPPSEDSRGTDGTNWSVAIVKFHSPHTWEYDVDYDNPMCKESDDVFLHVPDEQVDALVVLASRMDKCRDLS